MPRQLWAPWRLEYIEQADEAAGCIFCDAEPEYLVARGTHAFVMLNKYPYSSGHLLVAPYRHTADFGTLTPAEALEIHQLAAEGLRGLGEAYAPDGFNLGWNLGRVAGAGIDQHLHLHVVPRWNGDTNFMPVLGDTRVLPEALAETRRRLVAGWRPLQ